MDVLLIAAAGVLAPLLVFALWRLIPSDQHVTWSPARWAGDSDLAERRRRNPGTVDPDEHTETPMSRPILAEPPDGRVAVGPGKGTVQDATPRSSIRRLAVSGAPRAVRQSKSKSRSGTKVRSEPQWPPARSVNGYIRPEPSGGLSSMRGFSVAGSNVPRLRAEARERCDVCPRGAGPGARRRSGPAAERGGPLTQPKVASFGKELAALAAFARDGWCVSAPGPAETAFQLRKRGADCTKSTGHDGTRLQNRHLPRGRAGGQRCTASARGGRR